MPQADLKKDWLDGWDEAIKLTAEVALQIKKTTRVARHEQLSLEQGSAQEDQQVSEPSDEEAD